MDDATYRELAYTSIGYPCNLAYDFTPVHGSIAWNLNNVGDPAVPGTFAMHSKAEEARVVEFFKQLWHCPADAWGYVTSSGSESNLQGMLSARDGLSAEHMKDPVVYTTMEAHYSIAKIARMLRLNMRIVRSCPSGRMECDDLAASLDHDRPALVVANIGTTMKGAVDDVDAIRAATAEVPTHVHADAALMGAVLPFLDPRPFFQGVDSASVSGHKLLGTPFPCGVYVSRHKPRGSMQVTGSVDNTVAGSRNGHGAIFLDHIIRAKGMEGFAKDVTRCEESAQYLIDIMDPSWRAWRNNKSITVVMDRPPNAVVQRWQLAVQGERAHVITMPHVTARKLNMLVRDLRVFRPTVLGV